MDWPKRMSGKQESEPLHGKHQISSFICQGLCIAIQETYTRRCFRFFVLFIHSPIPSEYKLFCKGIDQLLAKGTVQAFMDYSLAQWLYSGWDAINKWLHWQWQCWIWPPVGTWWTNISDIGKDADDEKRRSAMNVWKDWRSGIEVPIPQELLPVFKDKSSQMDEASTVAERAIPCRWWQWKCGLLLVWWSTMSSVSMLNYKINLLKTVMLQSQ